MPILFDKYAVDLRPDADERVNGPGSGPRRGSEDREGWRRAPRADGPSIIGSALSRYKLWIGLLAILLAAAGAAYGIKRQPQYTASSTLNVGKVNPNSPGFYGYTQSASDLATTYSRAITATGVLSRVQKATGIPPVTAAGRLSAAPIPNSSLFRIIATGPSASSAIKLANETASGVIAFEAGYNFNGDAAAALSSYQAAERAAVQAQANASRLSAGGHGAAYQSAKIQASTDLMRASALSSQYQQALEAQPASNLVSLLTNAVGATSDKTKKIELFAVIGLLAGLAIGTLLAVLRQQRRLRRALEW